LETSGGCDFTDKINLKSQEFKSMVYTEYESVPFNDLTPMLQAYVTIKRRFNKQELVLFHVGDFYETFFEDAVTMASTLELVLTSKAAGEKVGRVPLAGIPAHAFDRYAASLIQDGLAVFVYAKFEDETKSGNPPRWLPVQSVGYKG
jgi:DNA mismatch repair protein MutS